MKMQRVPTSLPTPFSYAFPTLSNAPFCGSNGVCSNPHTPRRARPLSGRMPTWHRWSYGYGRRRSGMVQGTLRGLGAHCRGEIGRLKRIVPGPYSFAEGSGRGHRLGGGPPSGPPNGEAPDAHGRAWKRCTPGTSPKRLENDEYAIGEGDRGVS